MHAFEYIKPNTVWEAVDLLDADEDARPLAGGMTLLPTLKQRLAQPTQLVDLAGLEDLQIISEGPSSLTIGAMKRHVQVARSPSINAFLPVIAHLAEGIGDPHVRNRGTIGGSISNSDPAADYPAAVLGLGATVITNRREIDGQDFFTGLFSTALEQGEIVMAIRFPLPERAAYIKFPNPASRYAAVGVFVARVKGEARVAVTGAGPCAFRLPQMEEALDRSFAVEAIQDIEISQEGLNADPSATPEYRAHLIGVMARRAVEAAAR
ncbi:xanthine dehydrogenase family protein subunit M [Caulobacter sp. S45]|uniref:FAD binding domain-containing protein n=1 Tax=Caulobacter sp. S45 TaxID=1641861 RepID=UPI00131C4742|nr:xanthine dehydrogenase family protein subunit M [Caulobacter sp. S45]